MTPKTDSSTGGPIGPYGAPHAAPVEGKALLQVLQRWAVGITGLPSANVTVRWQPEPMNLPTMGEAWLAIGVLTRSTPLWPYRKHIPVGPDGIGADITQEHETLEVQASFYDLGSTGQADAYAALFRSSIGVPQNIEAIRNAANLFLADYGAITPAPSLAKQRWLYRVDFPFRLRRQIVRVYPIRNVESLDATVVANDAGDGSFTVPVTPTAPTGD